MAVRIFFSLQPHLPKTAQNCISILRIFYPMILDYKKLFQIQNPQFMNESGFKSRGAYNDTQMVYSTTYSLINFCWLLVASYFTMVITCVERGASPQKASWEARRKITATWIEGVILASDWIVHRPLPDMSFDTYLFKWIYCS